MNLDVQPLRNALAGQYCVSIEEGSDTMTIRCSTAAGEVVAVRIFSQKQLANQGLVDLVLKDLARILTKPPSLPARQLDQ